MRRFILLAILFIILAALFFTVNNKKKETIINPLAKLIEKPLDKYTFENLKKKKFGASTITLGKVLKDEKDFTSFMFYFYDPSVGSGQAKKVSGLMNLPKKEGNYPVIVMFRGFVPKGKFTTGEGTRASGEYLVQNGFITIAPDFLGFGKSASPSANSIEERFQTYTTASTLLASVKNLNSALEEKNINNITADDNKIGIWGHSNGGHISLSTLAITGKNYPTVLWAPVGKAFPYSILYFTDEYADNGKALRKVVADFERDYDIEKYSPTNFYNWINAPIQLHQGTNDEAVPLKWSDTLYNSLKKIDKDITYFTYPNENHNFNNGGWITAIQRSVQFYKSSFNN
ncbi:hypothetical protein C4559_01215 [Candidatus Microgenomates bacterium]|nr:MAG: hypothetical protein C4559_01215 [Candidatus Microgenomates bacterium]